MGNKNTNLHKAKKAKNDEFYTTRESVEMELSHYKEHFRGKVVYCNCDDPIESEFTWYFARKFEDWGLKKLISTGYKENGHGVMYVYEGDKNGNRMPDRDEWVVTELNGNGDFRSEECVELLKQADIVVSNEPFSLFREYLAQLIKYDKKFLVIGNSNAITYKEVFPLIKENKLWLGVNPVKEFITPLKEVENDKTQYMKDGKVYQKFGNICWFTNLTHSKRNRPLDLVQRYDERYYNVYDNYPAVNIDKVVDIPKDEDIVLTIPEEVYPKWKSVYGEDLSIVEDNGESVRVKVHNPIYGVPITFLDKYCPAQFRIDEQSEGHQSQGKKPLRKDIGTFRIIGCTESEGRGLSDGLWFGGKPQPMVNGVSKFKRILIRYFLNKDSCISFISVQSESVSIMGIILNVTVKSHNPELRKG